MNIQAYPLSVLQSLLFYDWVSFIKFLIFPLWLQTKYCESCVLGKVTEQYLQETDLFSPSGLHHANEVCQSTAGQPGPVHCVNPYWNLSQVCSQEPRKLQEMVLDNRTNGKNKTE